MNSWRGEKKCLCDSSDVRVVACSGASNVGQIANQAALELAKANVAGFLCLAGVGAHIKGMVKSAKEAGLIVAIDWWILEDELTCVQPYSLRSMATAKNSQVTSAKIWFWLGEFADRHAFLKKLASIEKA